MKTKVLTILVCVCSVVSFAQAQEKTPRYMSSQKKITFAVQPLQVLFGGFRFDIETRLGDGPGWLQFGPTIYSISKDRDNYYNNWRDDFFREYESFSKLNGAGLHINYKRFIDPYRSLYFAYGLSYSRFNLDYDGWLSEWKNYTEDGLAYHEYSFLYKKHTQHIDRMSINSYFGYQIPSRHAFLFDMFIGFSYRHAEADKDKPQFDSYTYSYGHTGFVFLTGVRFGIGLK